MRHTWLRSSVTARHGRHAQSRSPHRQTIPAFATGSARSTTTSAGRDTGAGDAAGALEAFELALASRERDDPRPYAREIARYAVGKALRALGRSDEAAAALEECVAWAAEAGVKDGYFHEELAEDYAALGRYADAREQARCALELTSEGDDPSRISRLRELADRSMLADSR